MELIDLNAAEPAELRKYLADNFGVEKAANTSREKLVVAIIEQEQAQGISRQEGSNASNLSLTGMATSEKRELDAQKKVKIRISRDPQSKGNDDVTVSINGVVYLMQREKVLDVPDSVYQVLLQASETRYEQTEDGTLVPRTVQSYPVSLVG